MGKFILSLALAFGSGLSTRSKAQSVAAAPLDSASPTASLSTREAVAAAPDQREVDDSPDWLFPISSLNKRLPNWLKLGGEYRARPESSTGIGFGGKSDSYLLDRLRVHVGIQPKEWLRFYSEVQDARISFNHQIPNANPFEDKWTLWQAYGQLGSAETGRVDVLVGRQALMFGDERVIGPSNWVNVGRTFNVARVDFHPSSYRVAVFAASVLPGDNTDLHHTLAGNNLFGVYGSFQNVISSARFEPYVLWRVAPTSSELPETLGRGHLNEVTIGLHLKGTAPGDLDYDTEFDGQTGSLGPSSIKAWAGYAEIGKTFRRVAASPRVFIEGNYASGTKHPAGREWNTFDQLYPSNHDKYGFADVVGRRNLEQFRAGVEQEPTRRWKLKEAFESYWLATSRDNFYSSSGAIAVAANPNASRHIGSELDLVAEYQLNKGLNLGFGYARLFAGEFLKATTPGHDYSYSYAYVEYNFSRSGFHFPVTPNRAN
jgi:hypothetical protein